MRRYRAPAPRAARTAVVLLLIAAVLGLVPADGPAPPGSAAPAVAPIPVGEDGSFLVNLTAPTLTSSDRSGSVGFSVHDPLPNDLSNVTLTLAIYAYAAALGSTSGAVPGSSLTWTVPGVSPGGPAVLTTVRSVGAVPSGRSRSGTAGIASYDGAPIGSYLIETSLAFGSGASSYRFESRGHFSAAQWSAALLPNGSNGAPGLNLSLLGVDGVTPETAVSVVAPDPGLPIELLGGAGAVLVAVGAYAYWRRGPGSRSGAAPAPAPQSAPSAFGKNRTSEGERRNS